MDEPSPEALRRLLLELTSRGARTLLHDWKLAGLVVLAHPKPRDDEFALVPDGLRAALAEWKGLGEPESAGEPVGRLAAKGWIPSAAAVVRAAQAIQIGLQVNDWATQRFLYGRDVDADGFLRMSPDLRPGQSCWVYDPQGEALGVGTLAETRKGLLLRPVIDLGWYLREGG